MATILSTPFEHDVVGGLGYDSLTHSESITQDLTVFRHGAASFKVTGNAANSIFGSKVVSTQVFTGSVYFRLAGLPAAPCLIVKCGGPTQAPTIGLNAAGRLQGHFGSNDGVSQTTTLATNTWYLLDYRFDTSTTTYKLDYRLSDQEGVLVEAASQLTLAGQTATAMTVAQAGQCASVALTAYFDDHRATDQSADYPLGPGVGDDGTNAPLTSFPPSWIDAPARVSGGALFGMMTMNTGSGDNGQAALSEGATKAYRPNYMPQSFYSDVTATPTFLFEKQVANGQLLGHQSWPMINPFGFGSTTVHWPAGGLADFTSGSMDSTLSALCAALNARMPQTPYLIRLFREMTNNVTIYGRNGSTVGGLNETTASFIAAWRYIYTYVTSRCTMARFVWCPDTNTAPSDTILWYPGDAYVHWVGVDAYGTSTNGYTPAPALQTWYAAYNPTNGTLGLTKPIGVCETSIQKTDPNRVADITLYTALIKAMPNLSFVCLWDSASAGPYYVSDSPAGFLAAFQGVVGSAPFLASLDTSVGVITITAADSTVAAIAAADSEVTVITAAA